MRHGGRHDYSEALMDWVALFALFKSWGPSAISSVLVIVVIYLIKEVNKNNENDTKRAQGLQALIDSKLKEFRDETTKTLDGYGRRLSCMELEYVKRETFYRELGGWKDDINRLSGQISAQFTEFNKSIVDIWKNRSEQ
jgi:hypothetical protein